MSFNLTKVIASVALAGTIALTASAAPAFADFRPHGGFHGGGGWHGGGWHGGYGGWHRGGGWGWAPFVLGGLAAGAIVAGATAPYYYGAPYYGDPCYRLTPSYDPYGNYVGRHWSYVCQ